jgi:hypothetical protein
MGVRRLFGKQFSDTITMSMPVGRGNLYFFLWHLMQVQSEIVNQGLFLRGAEFEPCLSEPEPAPTTQPTRPTRHAASIAV